MENKDKEIWRERWLSCINELTDLSLQKKSWLDRTHTNPHWSFIEFMNCYFSDLVIDDNYYEELKDSWVSKQEFEIIENWHKELDKYKSPKNDDYDHGAILNDQKWLEIIEIGVNAKIKLTKILNKREREFLTEEIDYLKYV